MRALEVLIVDDDKRVRQTLRTCLEGMDCRVTEASTAAGARAAVERRRFDLALVDQRLGDEDGIDLLPGLIAHRRVAAVVVITAFASITSAVESMRRGARNYLSKPFSRSQIRELVERTAEERRVESRLAAQREALERRQPELDLETRAPAMRRLLDLVARAAALDGPLVLHGEPGTGKTVIARRLHALGARSRKAFAVVDARARPEAELACALFGKGKSALLDDGSEQAGAVELADGGTLLITNVTALPMSLQASVVALLAHGCFQRVGERRERRTDVRLVATCEREPAAEVEGGTFLPELHERLKPIELVVPPLRDRREDILPLAQRLLSFYCKSGPVHSPELTLEAQSMLVAYAWPRNLVELRDAMERSAALRTGTRIGPELLPEAVIAGSGAVPQLGGAFTVEAVEREHILRVLAQMGTQEEAARVLGINVTTLWRKLKRYGV